MAVKTIPILPSDDFDQSVGFYERLGFAERGRWPDEYLILQRAHDSFELHFWFGDYVDPKENDVACYARWDTASEARALHDEWAAVDIGPGRLHPPTETAYGLLEFALVDAHGNLVRVGGSLDQLSKRLQVRPPRVDEPGGRARRTNGGAEPIVARPC